MEFGKKMFIVFLFSSLLFSTEAHRIAASPAPSPDASFPVPISKIHVPRSCKKLLSDPFGIFKLPNIIDPLLGQLCSITRAPAVCLGLVSPCMTGSPNPFSGLEGVILSLFQHVSHAIDISLKLRGDVTASPEVIAALNSCVEIYVKIFGNLQKALSAYNNHDIPTVKLMLIAAITDFGLCDEAFHQQGFTTKWPLKRIDATLTQLAEIGLDIIHIKFDVRARA